MRRRIGFERALHSTRERVPRLGDERVALAELCGRVLAEDVTARVDAPDQDVSLKDGYAVVSADVAEAHPDAGVHLEIVGEVNAGGACRQMVEPGRTVRITTGAPIPAGAEAVLAEEYCRRAGDRLLCLTDAEPGRNILRRATDLRRGQVLARRGERLDPALVGLLAAAGHDAARVARRPRLGLLATGDEIVAPGRPLAAGKLYASNLVEMQAWLGDLGASIRTAVCGDDRPAVRAAIESLAAEADVVLSSGGAWTSERDLLLDVLDELGWEGVYHRVRLGPGKGIAFGLLDGRAVFCLPGGPPSNEMALLQLAMPGLLSMQGFDGPVFRERRVRLTEPVSGQSDWTQFVHGRLVAERPEPLVEPLHLASRLQSMARKQVLIPIPEGCGGRRTDEWVWVQQLAAPAWR